MESENIEKTFVMILPEGLKRGLVGKTISRLEESGLKIIACRMIKPTKEQAEVRYQKEMIEYISSNPVVLMVWVGPNAHSTAQEFASKGLVTTCESADKAEEEISFWFGDKYKDLGDYTKIDFVGSFEALK